MGNQGDARNDPEPFHFVGGHDGGFRDLFGRGFRRDMGVRQKNRSLGHDEHAQRAHFLNAATNADHVDHMVQVQIILPLGAANHRVGLATMEHDRADNRIIGPHHRFFAMSGETPLRSMMR